MMNRWRSVRTSLLCLPLALVACQQSDPRGRYDIAIVIEGAGAPVEGVLVVGASMLELDSLATDLIVSAAPQRGATDYTGATDDSAIYADEDDFVGAVNSCLAIASLDPEDPRPRSVRFFDVRLRGSEVEVPFPIFEGGDQRIEVTKLKFVANTLGGEVKFLEGNIALEGRIFGDRMGPAAAEQCLEQLRQYEEKLREQIKNNQKQAH